MNKKIYIKNKWIKKNNCETRNIKKLLTMSNFIVNFIF